MILYWFVVCVVFLSEIYVLHTYLLLPVYGEIFEKLIFNSYFEYLDEQKLLSEHQSSFRPNDSCTNQLLSIVPGIYRFRCWFYSWSLRCVSRFVKSFWQNLVLIYKLKQVGVSGEALALINSFLNNIPACNT